MAMALKGKKLTVHEKMRIIQDTETNPTILQVGSANCLCLPPLSLSNILLQRASVLEVEGKYVAQAKEGKILRLHHMKN
jgi:hypothetical protein